MIRRYVRAQSARRNTQGAWVGSRCRFPGHSGLSQLAIYQKPGIVPTLIEAATNQGCLIFWIAVKSSTFADSPLAKFQGAIPPHAPLALMSEGEQAKVLLDIYEKMKAAVSVQ
jgi:hypothetical protein